MSEINPNNENDDFRTPRDLFSSLDDRFSFTLDAAASHDNALCPDYFTEDDDGLKQKWSGVVWCNPPYSNVEPWISKALAELEVKNCEMVVFLLNMDSSTRWFHELILPFVRELHLVRGRVSFGGPHAMNGLCNPKPSFVAVFDQQLENIGARYLTCIDTGGMPTLMQTRLPI